MKNKTILVTTLITIIAIIVILFVYSRLSNRSGQTPVNPGFGTTEGTVPEAMTPSQGPEGPVDFIYAAEQTVQAVVHVRVRSTVSGGNESDNPLFEFFYGNNANPQPRKVTGFGSGVIISPDGYIITNNHVIVEADSIQVTLNNNKTYIATLVGRDPDTDIALLKIQTNSGLASGYWLLVILLTLVQQ